MHLKETDLLELYAGTCGRLRASAEGDALRRASPKPPENTAAEAGTSRASHPHLAQCPSCAARFAAVVDTLDAHAEDVRAEADAFFTEDRLSRQRDRILHRLHHVGQFARIIPFPMRSAADGLTMLRRGSMARLVSRRWVAAAAAAGLVLGFFVERAIRDPHMFSSESSSVARQNTPRLSAVAQSTPHLVAYEETILDEVDAVLSRQPAPELHALDAITPRGLW